MFALGDNLYRIEWRDGAWFPARAGSAALARAANAATSVALRNASADAGAPAGVGWPEVLSEVAAAVGLGVLDDTIDEDDPEDAVY